MSAAMSWDSRALEVPHDAGRAGLQGGGRPRVGDTVAGRGRQLAGGLRRPAGDLGYFRE